MLKTRPKQLLGSLPLDIALPGHRQTEARESEAVAIPGLAHPLDRSERERKRESEKEGEREM
jgi:hypothetical protein